MINEQSCPARRTDGVTARRTAARPQLKPKTANVAAAGRRRRGTTGGRRFLWLTLLTLGAAIAVGFGLARHFAPPWFDFASPDKDYTASFRQEPLMLRVPVTHDWANEMMQTVTLRGFWGLDEINRLTGVKTADAPNLWLAETLAQSGAELKHGDAQDYTAFLPRESVWMRGRIMFSPQGGTIYRIWILRVTEEELTAPSSIRFLYSFDFAAAPLR